MNLFYHAGRFVSYAKRSYAEGLLAHTVVTESKAQTDLANDMIGIMKADRVKDAYGYNIGGGYIAAIKAYRARTGSGLKVSKDYIDALAAKYDIEKI